MWDLVAFAQGDLRKKTMKALCLGPRTPMSIANDYNVHLSNVSRSLRELSEKGLVECLSPEAKKNRIYGLTELGKEVLKEMWGMESRSPT